MTSRRHLFPPNLLPNLRDLRSMALEFGRSVALSSLVVTALLVGLRQAGSLESLELGLFDQMVRWRPDRGPDDRLLIVGISEQDIQTIQEATISDQNLNRLLAKLETYQPRVIGLNIFRDVPIGTGRTDLLKRLQQSDRMITACRSGTAETPGVPPPLGVPADRAATVDQIIDLDGVVRRGLLFAVPEAREPAQKSAAAPSNLCDNPDASILSLSFRLALRYLQAQGVEPQMSATQQLKLGSTPVDYLETNSGGYQRADVVGYQILINYRSPERVARQVTLTDVLDGKVDPSWIKDRIVLIGYTASSKNDDFLTPYSVGQQTSFKMPGVVVQAQVVSQLLSAVLDGRSLFWFWSDAEEMVWIAAWSLLGGLIAWRVRHPIAFGVAGVLTLGSLVGISFVIFTQAGWIPVTAPMLALVATAGSVVLVDRFDKGGYAKKLYRGVQKLFKIEIDEDEKSRQLTEYEDMISRVQQWQQQAQELPDPLHATELTSTDRPVPAAEDTDLDYFEQVRRRAAALEQETAELPSPEQPAVTEPTISEPDLDYFEQVRRKAAALDQADLSASVETSQDESDYLEQVRRKAAALEQDLEATHSLVVELSETELAILNRYCQKTARSQTEVLKDWIRSLPDA